MHLSWFVRPHPRPTARIRLFCFPYAGVGASAYRGWAADLPAGIELCAVQPPGRETRLREAAIPDLRELVLALGECILPLLDRPFAFFGHSMGALTAFELARHLGRTGGGAPAFLFASARRAPRLPDTEPALHTLPDDTFVAEIQRRYGGIPEEVLRHRELVELLLPGLRADIQAVETYSYVAGDSLDCPILAFGGAQDSRATAQELEGWREESRGPFTLRMFAGGHFFLQSARVQVLAAIAAALRQPLLTRAPAATGV